MSYERSPKERSGPVDHGAVGRTGAVPEQVGSRKSAEGPEAMEGQAERRKAILARFWDYLNALFVTEAHRKQVGGKWYRLRDFAGGWALDFWDQQKPQPEDSWLVVVEEKDYSGGR
jgi:hypothetical protein